MPMYGERYLLSTRMMPTLIGVFSWASDIGRAHKMAATNKHTMAVFMERLRWVKIMDRAGTIIERR